MQALGKARKVADLFCGLGTFSFAMARRASVTAVENDRLCWARWMPHRAARRASSRSGRSPAI